MVPPPPDVEAQKHGRFLVTERVSEERKDVNRLVQPGSRLPVEYRTLSVHVEDHSTPDAGAKGKDVDKRKKAVKGEYTDRHDLDAYSFILYSLSRACKPRLAQTFRRRNSQPSLCIPENWFGKQSDRTPSKDPWKECHISPQVQHDSQASGMGARRVRKPSACGVYRLLYCLVNCVPSDAPILMFTNSF